MHSVVDEYQDVVVEHRTRAIAVVETVRATLQFWHGNALLHEGTAFDNVPMAIAEARKQMEAYEVGPDSSLRLRIRESRGRTRYVKDERWEERRYLYGDTLGPEERIFDAHVWDSHAGALVPDRIESIPFRLTTYVAVATGLPVGDIAPKRTVCEVTELANWMLWKGWSFRGVSDAGYRISPLDGPPANVTPSRSVAGADWHALEATGRAAFGLSRHVSNDEARELLTRWFVPEIPHERGDDRPGVIAWYVGPPVARIAWGADALGSDASVPLIGPPSP